VRPEDLLGRVAGELRRTVGPGVTEPFARTQAFMAAVILEKLGRQLRSADSHADADRTELRALLDELGSRLGDAPPSRTRTALAAADDGGGTVDTGLGGVIVALYADRVELGSQLFDDLLSRVRRVLRARLERELQYAS